MVDFGGIDETLKLDKKIKKRMNEKVNIDKQTLDKWEETDMEIVTSIVRELSYYLFPTPDVTILEKDTAGDQYFKVDIIMDFPEFTLEATDIDNLPETTFPARSIAFQCKSSKVAAENFIDKYKDGVVYKGKKYPCPGVYYNNADTINECFTIEQLKNLGEFTNSIVHPKIIAGIDILLKLKKIAERDQVYVYLDQRRFQPLLDSWVWSALEKFKFISTGGGRIIYKF